MLVPNEEIVKAITVISTQGLSLEMDITYPLEGIVLASCELKNIAFKNKINKKGFGTLGSGI